MERILNLKVNLLLIPWNDRFRPNYTDASKRFFLLLPKSMAKSLRDFISSGDKFIHKDKNVEMRRFVDDLASYPIEDREQVYFDEKQKIIKNLYHDTKGLKQIWFFGENKTLKEFRNFFGDKDSEYIDPVLIQTESCLFRIYARAKIQGGEVLNFREIDHIRTSVLAPN